MNLNSLDYLFVSVYFLGLVAFGALVRRIGKFGDYAVGGRSVPGVMIFASLCAAYIGPGYTMGFASKGFVSGWLFFFVALAFSAQTLLTGLFIAPRLQEFKSCYTVGDIIGTFHGKTAHVVAGLISTVLCIGLASIMAKVGGLVLQSATGMPLLAGISLVTGVGVFYCYTGGLKSVIATEAMQFSIYTTAVPLLLWIGIYQSQVRLNDLDVKAWADMQTASASMTPLQIAGLFLSFFLGEALIPPYAIRALAANSSSIARRGFVAGAAYSVLWFAMVVGVGVVARATVSSSSPDDAFISFAVKYLPHGLLGLLIVAITSVVMSSQESVLNAGAISLTRDIQDTLAVNANSDEQRLFSSRASTVAMGALAAALAYFSPSIIDGLLVIYSLWAPSVLPVLLLAIFVEKPVRRAGAPSMIVGAVASLMLQFGWKSAGQLTALSVGLGANLLTYSACVAFLKEPRAEAFEL